MASAFGSSERTALIVGAGIGGLAAGVALRRAGWNVQIFERAASPRELGFALLLAPNAMSALRRLGLADMVIAGGARVTGGEIRRADGRLLRTFDATNMFQVLPEPPVVVLRPLLHGALLNAVGRDTVTLGSSAVFWLKPPWSTLALDQLVVLWHCSQAVTPLWMGVGGLPRAPR